ncbi:NPP1-domain-containing protein [Sodiomyces alkalinus F11]|uniref:NPP1-domain-containing protein n=1 Tax=Sodiomyces alkalinus (strain CBS 110278 / VKM F-3762 / F11) TaxID=1314773 RepID=A0A3N2QA87_SODAK|nr:NPP1-domain-containing protein [Sodiomyces alkalinus F11]ROT43661.1 NPP1-domain-containing protein [Sodiomyces alkalinus F11]
MYISYNNVADLVLCCLPPVIHFDLSSSATLSSRTISHRSNCRTVVPSATETDDSNENDDINHKNDSGRFSATAPMRALSYAIVGLLGALVALGEILRPLPESADPMDLKYQPYLDFDLDSCYNTAAVNIVGRRNRGATKPSGQISGNCRWRQQLLNSNAYARRRCNNGVCAIMYAYYFEKDQRHPITFLHGHNHDWENVVVFIKKGRIVRVAPSCGKDYVEAQNFDFYVLNGTHPLVVYHKGFGEAHCMRQARRPDIEQVENHFGHWYRSPLVSWNRWPSPGLRDLLQTFIRAQPRIVNGQFGDSLHAAINQRNPLPEFDPYLDREGPPIEDVGDPYDVVEEEEEVEEEVVEKKKKGEEEEVEEVEVVEEVVVVEPEEEEKKKPKKKIRKLKIKKKKPKEEEKKKKDELPEGITHRKMGNDTPDA